MQYFLHCTAPFDQLSKMEEAADQHLEYDEGAADPSITASIISITQLATDLASESHHTYYCYFTSW